MIRPGPVLTIALAAGIAAAAGCASDGSVAAPRADAEIAGAVRAAFATDPGLNPFAVIVDVRDGVVTLSGRAPDADARVRAERLARAVDGVRSVVNLLEVGAP